MSDGSACFCGCDGGAACIGKQVQDFDRTAGVFDGFPYYRRKPVPVGSLLRKQPGMFETERLQMKSQFAVLNAPFVRQLEKFPFAASFGASVVMAVHFSPPGMFFWRIPDNLWVRPDKQIVPPPLQFFTGGSIDYFIVFPIFGCPHCFLTVPFFLPVCQAEFART